MTQRPRAEYEYAMKELAGKPLMSQTDKTNAMLNIITDILLDIREKLFNPDMKAPEEPRK